MGVSTDAILAYGFPIGDDDGVWDALPWWEAWQEAASAADSDDTYLPEAFITRMLPLVGFNQPEPQYPSEAWEAWHTAKWAARRVVDNELKLEIVEHCAERARMYLLSCSTIRVRRGAIRKVTVDDLAVDPDWERRLRLGLQALELEWPGDPAWQLVSWWS